MKQNEIARLLEECERGLRGLVADAAKEGDYQNVVRIADLAKAVAALAENNRSNSADAQISTGHGSLVHSNNIRPNIVATRKVRPSLEEYPKFFRRGDELVKVGWSKTERKEYHHRAPRSVVDAVAVSLKQVGSKGRLFNGDALLPLRDPASGGPIPDYQVYVALAWLKQLGLVNQHGRRAGFTLSTDKQMESEIPAAWLELMEWRG